MDYFIRNIAEIRKAGPYDADIIIITTIPKGGGVVSSKFLM